MRVLLQSIATGVLAGSLVLAPIVDARAANGTLTVKATSAKKALQPITAQVLEANYDVQVSYDGLGRPTERRVALELKLVLDKSTAKLVAMMAKHESGTAEITMGSGASAYSMKLTNATVSGHTVRTAESGKVIVHVKFYFTSLAFTVDGVTTTELWGVSGEFGPGGGGFPGNP